MRGLILALMAEVEKPLKGASIARRLGRRETSHFRGVLAQLRRDGKLHNGGDGYWLASRGPCPKEARP